MSYSFKNPQRKFKSWKEKEQVKALRLASYKEKFQSLASDRGVLTAFNSAKTLTQAKKSFGIRFLKDNPFIFLKKSFIYRYLILI